MINHARTLLLNLRPVQNWNGQDGEEYIDPAFAPLQPPPGLFDVRSVLVPSGGERASVNFRVNTLLVLIHAPDFDAYTRTFDSRITYVADSFTYASESAARTDYPSFNLARLYSGLVAAMGRTGYNLFDTSGFMQDDMITFKDIWYGNLALKDKITAAVLAAAYMTERYRQYGI